MRIENCASFYILRSHSEILKIYGVSLGVYIYSRMSGLLYFYVNRNIKILKLKQEIYLELSIFIIIIYNQD